MRAIVLGLAAAALAGGAAQAADVLVNAHVWTVNPAQPRAEAVAIDDSGVIRAVGTAAQARAALPGARVIDMKGAMILPGFQDAHLHALEAGINEVYCPFGAFDDMQGHRESIQACMADWQGGWILGSGVNMQALLAEDPNPVALLDAETGGVPALILDDIGHGAWANSAALKAVGYDAMRGDPPGGKILRDLATGKPNGVVLENAQQALRNRAFPPSPANLDRAYDSLLSAQDVLAQNGVTAVGDAGGYWPQGHPAVWRRAEAAGALKVRASNALYVYPDLPFDQQIKDLTAQYSNDAAALVRFNQAKIYVDGILSQATGAVLAPYEAALDLPKDAARGFLYFDENTLARYAKTLSEAGFQLHFHVTGDRAARLALDVIAGAEAAPGPHRLTHLYLVDPADFPRFKALGVVADLQLAPSALDPDYVDGMREMIGDRADRMMPAAELMRAGALVTLSSDWDADELSPLVKIATVAMRDHGAIAPEDAIRALTINPARLLRHADRTGSIEVGKLADLAIIDRDILSLPPEDIAEASVSATLLAGKATFDGAGLFGGN